MSVMIRSVICPAGKVIASRNRPLSPIVRLGVELIPSSDEIYVFVKFTSRICTEALELIGSLTKLGLSGRGNDVYLVRLTVLLMTCLGYTVSFKRTV